MKFKIFALGHELFKLNFENNFFLAKVHQGTQSDGGA